MKTIYHIILVVFAFTLWNCQDDNTSLNSGTGYLRLTISESEEVNTRASYNPDQIQVIIREKESKKEIKSTDDWENWEGESIELAAGEYTIIAKSYNYDNERGFDKPYYYGSQDVTVVAGKENNATVTCKLANVKVTVQYEDALLKALEGHTYSVEVGSSEEDSGIAPLLFENDEARAAYFPVSELYAKITVDGTQTLTQDLEGVKAQDHYILNYKLTDKGSSNVTVAIDPTHNEYAYTFEINMTPVAVTAEFKEANAWATFAYLEASKVESTTTTVEPSNVSFQYRKKGATDWIKVKTFHEYGVYTARPTGLDGATEYEYCLAVGNENTSAETFITENATPLENGSFEKWCEKKASTALISNTTTFPCSAEEYEMNARFWDTSNRGANSLKQEDPTKSTTHAIKGTAAELKTISVAGFLAAASLYTGDFGKAAMTGSATLNFGKPFTSRPIALRGYYQYLPETIDKLGDNLPNDATVSVNAPDQCSIYIALAKKSYTIDNSKPETFIDFAYDDNIIAYGVLESGDATPGDGYVDLNIPLRYKEEFITEIPTHIIIVCSASKYGDYFTGGEGSTLYLDELMLDYEGELSIWPKSERPDK